MYIFLKKKKKTLVFEKHIKSFPTKIIVVKFEEIYQLWVRKPTPLTRALSLITGPSMKAWQSSLCRPAPNRFSFWKGRRSAGARSGLRRFRSERHGHCACSIEFSSESELPFAVPSSDSADDRYVRHGPAEELVGVCLPTVHDRWRFRE